MMSSESPIKSTLRKPKKKSSTLLSILVFITLVLIGFIIAFALIVCNREPESAKTDLHKLNVRKWPSTSKETRRLGPLNGTGSVVHEAKNIIRFHQNEDSVKETTISQPQTTAKLTTIQATTAFIISKSDGISNNTTESALLSSYSTSVLSTEEIQNTTTSVSTDLPKINESVDPSFTKPVLTPVLAEHIIDSEASLSDKIVPSDEVMAKFQDEFLSGKDIIKTKKAELELSSVLESKIPLPILSTNDVVNMSINSAVTALNTEKLPNDFEDSALESNENESSIEYEQETVKPDANIVQQHFATISSADTPVTETVRTSKTIILTTATPSGVFITPEKILPYFEFKKFLSTAEPTNFVKTGSVESNEFDHAFSSEETVENNYDFELSTDPNIGTFTKNGNVNDIPFGLSLDVLRSGSAEKPFDHSIWNHLESLTTVTTTTDSATTTTTWTVPTTTTVTMTTSVWNPILTIENDIPVCAPKKHQDCFPGGQNSQTSQNRFPSEDLASQDYHFGGLRPRHYNLNLTIHRGLHITIEGDVQIMLDVIEETSTIFVNVGRSLSNIDLTQIEVTSCTTGRVICVASMVQHLREELLVIQLIEAVPRGEILNLQISGFNNPRTSEGVIVQNPHRWETKRPWTVVTFFQLRKARTVFPCIDMPTLKASLNLCITHSKDTTARSNTQTISENEVGGDSMVTCFKRTPKMSTYLYAFAVYDRMHSMEIPKNSQHMLPQIEVVYPEQMGKEKPEWMKAETAQALKLMENFTGYRYPLDKITLFASPLPVQGMENFGLILLNEQWVAYPMYPVAHTILVHEIVHQWIGNIVTVSSWDELCLQEGLSTYVAYEITKDLLEVPNKIRELQEKRLQGIERDSRSRIPIIGDFQTYEDALRCFDKPVLFFEMLSDGFGSDVVRKFTRSLITEYAFKNANFQVWQYLVSKAAGTEVAGKFLKDYFTRPGIPILRAKYGTNQLQLSQTLAIEGREIAEAPFVVPLTVSLEPNRSHITLLVNDTEQSFTFDDSELIILDPDSKAYAIIIYEAEFYAKLLRCALNDSCNYIDKDGLERILKDFCWAFLNDHLLVTNSGPDALKLWKEITRHISSASLVQGTCACCMDKKIQKSGEVYCKWHWKDRCESIQLAKELQKLV